MEWTIFGNGNPGDFCSTVVISLYLARRKTRIKEGRNRHIHNFVIRHQTSSATPSSLGISTEDIYLFTMLYYLVVLRGGPRAHAAPHFVRFAQQKRERARERARTGAHATAETPTVCVGTREARTTTQSADRAATHTHPESETTL